MKEKREEPRDTKASLTQDECVYCNKKGYVLVKERYYPEEHTTWLWYRCVACLRTWSVCLEIRKVED